MINMGDFYMGRQTKFAEELTPELEQNARITVDRVNQLLEAFGESRAVNSGWRPVAINAATANAASKSKHTTCQACDLSDDDERLDQWCLDHPEELARIGLWQEHPEATPRWCHVQIVPPKSGNRVFRP